MNLLLVTYSFPPAAGVGVLRAFSLAKYLPENGLRVDVLTTRNAAAVGHDSSLLSELPNDLKIHRTWTLDLPFGLRKAIKKTLSRPTVRASSVVQTSAGQGGWRATFKRLLGNVLLPDPQIGWLPFASTAARRLIRSRSIDAVLVTVPPFSGAGLVTMLRREFPHLPIVLDFRDEWLTTTIDLVSYNNNDRARKVAERVEHDAIRDATLVVCVTQAAVRELRRRYPKLPAKHLACIPNGFDGHQHNCAPKDHEQGQPIVLTYIGTVYNSTDPAPIVDAILSLPELIRRRLHLRFIGHIESEQHRRTLSRLHDQVELVGWLPQSQALAYMQNTTYLLLITHDPVNVAAKLYDYLASGVPILAAVHWQGDVRKILEQTRAGRVADVTDRQAIAQMFAEAVTLGNSCIPDQDAIGGFHRSVLSARYASLLRSILPEAVARDVA